MLFPHPLSPWDRLFDSLSTKSGRYKAQPPGKRCRHTVHGASAAEVATALTVEECVTDMQHIHAFNMFAWATLGECAPRRGTPRRTRRGTRGHTLRNKT